MENILSGALPLGWYAWGTIGVLGVVWGIYSGIMYWHWRLYSTGRYTTVASMLVYLAGSAFFFLLMSLGALWLSIGV